MFRLALHCSILTLAICTLGNSAHADTLEAAVVQAYQNNPALRGNRALAEAADESVIQAKAAYGPSLNVAARHSYTTSRVRGTVLPSEDDGFGTTVEFSLSQPLFTSGRLAAGVDAATADTMIVRETLRGSTQQLMLDAINAYVSLARDLEIYGVVAENYDLLVQQREATAARYRLRDSTEADLQQTINRVELAAGSLANARATVESSAARYRNVVGHYPDALEPPKLLPALPTLDTLYVEAERTNPELTAAKFAEARSRAIVGSARSAMRPQVNAFASASRVPISPYQNTVRQESVVAGVSMTLQLYSGGLQSSQVREALKRNEADQQFTEQTRRNMRETLASDWNLLQAMSIALPHYEAAVAAAQSAVEGVKRQETSGIRTLRDVLDVTNDLLSARTAAAQTRAAQYLRHAAILRGTGLLSIELFGPVTPYDPETVKPAMTGMVGLPLGPVLEPLDRLLLNARVRRAAIEQENSPVYQWPANAHPPTSPVEAAGSRDDRRQ